MKNIRSETAAFPSLKLQTQRSCRQYIQTPLELPPDSPLQKEKTPEHDSGYFEQNVRHLQVVYNKNKKLSVHFKDVIINFDIFV